MDFIIVRNVTSLGILVKVRPLLFEEEGIFYKNANEAGASCVAGIEVIFDTLEEGVLGIAAVHMAVTSMKEENGNFFYRQISRMLVALGRSLEVTKGLGLSQEDAVERAISHVLGKVRRSPTCIAGFKASVPQNSLARLILAKKDYKVLHLLVFFI